MTARALADILLSYYSPEEQSVPDSVSYPKRNASVLAAINGALQELYGEGQAWMRRQSRGAKLYAPTPVTIAVAADSHDGTITGWADWMEGCSIVINGGSIDNEILEHSTGGAVTLRFPYDGPTGNQAATVYCDAINLADNVTGVLKPVRIMNGPRLAPVTDPDKLRMSPSLEDDYGQHRLIPNPPLPNLRIAEFLGTPQLYCCDSLAETYDQPSLRLRLAPAPDRAMMLAYRATIAPPVITAADLDSAPTLPVPAGYAESILMPIAIQRLVATPYFRDHAGKDEIARAYTAALALASSLRPQKSSGMTIRPFHG